MVDVKAEDIMTRKVITLRPGMHVFDAMDVLLKHRISGAPVLDGRELVGVLSEYDCLKVAGQGFTDLYQPSAGPVREYMSPPTYTVEPDASLAQIASIFLTRRIRRLPVVDAGRLVGLVSRHDVLRGMAEHGRPQEAQRYPDYRRPS